MRIFEYMRKTEMEKLSWDQQRFLAKVIKRDVDRIAEEMDITPEEATYWYSKGLYGGDRELDFPS